MVQNLRSMPLVGQCVACSRKDEREICDMGSTGHTITYMASSLVNCGSSFRIQLLSSHARHTASICFRKAVIHI